MFEVFVKSTHLKKRKLESVCLMTTSILMSIIYGVTQIDRKCVVHGLKFLSHCFACGGCGWVGEKSKRGGLRLSLVLGQKWQ